MAFERAPIVPDKRDGSDDEGSPAIRAGDLLFIASQHGMSAGETAQSPGDTSAQAKKALERIRQIITTAGGTMDDIVDVVGFFVDIRDAEDVLNVARDFFRKDYPAWTFMGTQGLPKEGRSFTSMPLPTWAKAQSSASPRIVWRGGGSIRCQALAAKANTSLYQARWLPISTATSRTLAATRHNLDIFFIVWKNWRLLPEATSKMMFWICFHSASIRAASIQCASR